LAVLTVLASSTLGLVGCADAGTEVANSPASSPTVVGPAALVWEATNGDFDGSQLIGDTRNALIEQCLADQGFGGVVAGGGSITGDVEAAEAAYLDHWWGVSQAKYGAEYGYREVPVETLLTVEYSSGSAPPGYFEAYWGDEGVVDGRAGGCAGYADAVIYEGSAPAEELNLIASEIEAQIESLTRADARLVEASAVWSVCMAEEGYTFADPHEAFASFATFVDDSYVGAYGGGPSPDEEEKRTAQADGACKESVGFWDARDEAEEAAKAAVATSMRSEIDKVREAHARQLENAKAAQSTLKDG
jgi:hypothetical protein